MREFGPNLLVGGGSDDFERWMKSNPEGYFVNLTSAKTARLHRATCPHMTFRNPVNFVSRRKWVSENRSELVDRAHREHLELRPCADCDL